MKLFTVHGAFARSSAKVMSPRVVATSTVTVPLVLTLPLGGWPTFLVGLPPFV